jgi:hypothetical protein
VLWSFSAAFGCELEVAGGAVRKSLAGVGAAAIGAKGSTTAVLARQITRRRAVCGQEEHLKVWRSNPGIVAMSARTTPVNSIFAPQAAHCIAHFSPVF